MNWHALDREELLKQLSVHPEKGLSREEARKRLAESGPNELMVEEAPPPWIIFFAQFKDPLVVLLLVATLLSALVGEMFDAGLIFTIVLFSAVLGFVQEYRAERAVEALRKMLSPSITVLRAGEAIEVPVRTLVPGDMLLLEAGDRVPADARVWDGYGLKADEAPLTGESEPVDKTPQALPSDARVSDQRNMLFMGTSVVHGRGLALVVSTGMDTEFGRIAREVGKAKDVKTPLERRTAEIGKWLGALSVGIIVLVVVVGAAQELWAGPGLSLEFALTMAMFGIALAVAAVPEALAGIVTGTLAVGMQRMARQNALVRNMPAVEALGSVTVICSDKTGTITKGEITVRRLYAGGASVEVTGVGYEPKGEFRPPDANKRHSLLFKAGLLCNDASLNENEGTWRIQGDPTEAALVVLAAKAGMEPHEVRMRHARVDEVPFSSERKRMTTVHETPEGRRVAFTKGAPEVVLKRCTAELHADGQTALDAARREAVLEISNDMASEGLRVLALAYREVTAETEDAEHDLTLLGLVGMIDPPREESADAVEACRKVGIRPVMITGDHKLTAMAVSREVGIYRNGDKALTGEELAALGDEEFEAIVDRVSVYARVSPADKLKIIRAWKKRGHIVAMTGDGVNDAPALKHADVGVAMGITGTEVSKEAADIVLADDNFATILKAVEMGRWIYDNIKKYLTFLLHANIVEVTVIGGVVLSRGAEYLPMLPPAILYVNLITDGLPAIALGFSPPEPDVMQRPPRNPREGVFSSDVKAFIFLSLLFAPVFFWVFFRTDDLLLARTELFFLFVVFELAMALNLRSLRYSLFEAPPHGWLIASVVGSIAVTAVVTTSPAVREAFGVMAPGVEGVEIMLVVVVAVTLLSELVKVALRRREEELVKKASAAPSAAPRGGM